jgi:hypothetical protein
MGNGASGALALLLLWIAFACFFTAFHPGGLLLDNGVQAQNPRDVITWFMERISHGPSLSIQAPVSAGASAPTGGTAA